MKCSKPEDAAITDLLQMVVDGEVDPSTLESDYRSRLTRYVVKRLYRVSDILRIGQYQIFILLVGIIISIAGAHIMPLLHYMGVFFFCCGAIGTVLGYKAWQKYHAVWVLYGKALDKL